MSLVTNVIQDQLAQTIKDEYDFEINPQDIHIEHPENKKWGDYATNVALKISKEVKQSPQDIAKNLSYKLLEKQGHLDAFSIDKPIFENIEVASPGFINFKIDKKWLLNLLGVVNGQEIHYGSLDLGQKKRIALEHSNVNPNKAAHVGHLRNASIGQFLERIYENLNYDVEVQYYANDVGVQVATSTLGVEKITEFSETDYKKYDHYAWDVYSAISNKLDSSTELKKELEELLISIEDPTNPNAQKQQRLADKILKNQIESFYEVGFEYDVIIHERDIIYLKFWEEAFEMLKNNDNVYFAEDGPSKGCWLIRTSANSLNIINTGDSDIEEDKIIVRSNGVPTYTGKDIAYHMWKFGLLTRDFYYDKISYSPQEKDLWETHYEQNTDNKNDISFSNVDIVFDVIDVKQTYAIDVVKNSLKFLGFEEESNLMTHINYGFVYLSPSTAQKLGIDTSDGKEKYGMSGRKGWGIKIDDLIELVDRTLVDSYGNFSALRAVRNGAIKFELLRHNTFQDMIFDVDEALNIKGYTGPYIQYTHARANSILEKGNYKFDSSYLAYLEQNVRLDLISSSEELVMRTVQKFPDVVFRSATTFAPNLLCEYLFELSQVYNNLYNDSPILTAEDEYQKEFRLLLTISVKIVLKNGLELLGIEAPNKI